MTEGALLFDTHAHVLSADPGRYPYSTLRGGARPPVSPLVFPVEELVRELDDREQLPGRAPELSCRGELTHEPLDVRLR